MTMKEQGTNQRLDQWLWHARFFKSRTLAQRAVQARKIRVNQMVVPKPDYRLKAGDVLTFTQGAGVRVVRVRDVGARRGPAVEARQLYTDVRRETVAADALVAAG
ncbi:MAG: S4 domain-containing protein [Geminicoccaceae bacterium]